jgi:hypothetical protein
MQIRVSFDPPNSLEGYIRIGDRALPAEFAATVMDDVGTEPSIEFSFAIRNGAPECRQVTFTSHPEGREVLTKDLRGIKVDDWLEYAVAYAGQRWSDEAGGSTKISWDVSAEGGREMVRKARIARREARRRVTPELLQEVASVYRAHIDGQPTEAVAEHFNKAHRTAALYVKQAREAGFLGASVRGKAGEQ